MNCTSCGASIDSSEKRCHYCGSKIEIHSSDKSHSTSHYLDEEILVKHCHKLINDKIIKNGKLHLHPQIPSKKTINVIKTYGTDFHEKEIIFFMYDSSAFGSGKTGIFLTDRFLYCYLNGETKTKIGIPKIENIMIKSSALKGELYVNNHYIGYYPSVGTTLKNDFYNIFNGIFKCKLT